MSATSRRARLDTELVRRGLAGTRTEAQRLIAGGRILVDGAPAGKPATQVAPVEPIAVIPAPPLWASRGGYKLAAAMDRLGVDPAGLHCLDAGASTGGFTDVLLARGAAQVIAVDVGYGQLAWRLANDQRVVVLDRTNVRHLTPAAVPAPRPELVVADLSFISLALVLPALRTLAADSADYVLLVKPQFEAGAGRVGRGGVVRDPAVWEEAVRRVAGQARTLGLGVVGLAVSPLPGAAGNVEFFLHLRAGEGDGLEAAFPDALAEARALVLLRGSSV